MGMRANETGQLDLNSTQQTNCLTKINEEGNGIVVFSCGIEILTRGGGSCSDFTVNDVNMKLADKLRSLTNNCQFYQGGQSCQSCINSWKNIKEMNSENDKYMKVQSDICRFAVLPTNILLGQNFEAKLSDFGLSKVKDIDESYMISEVRGTFGYVDPEYETNHCANSAGDVYSLGIVLLQILSGRKVINMNMEHPTTLDKIARLLMRERRAMEFVDPKLYGDYSTEAFQLTLELAISCIEPKQNRPSIEKVVDKLEDALAITASKHVRWLEKFENS
ncbi:putative receptor-like protein kinase At5g18500 [Nicotiana tabacum]|uniref:Receptor-like protein kinase At5g18500 n=1 Tax=Nicotiana tabacum TaxID=4097 RepID=A0AC58T3N5_TOBAC